MATTSKPRTPTAKARANRTQTAAAKTGRDRRANGKRTTPPPPPRSGRGGARPGSGRKPNIPGLPRLHGKPTLDTLRAACAAAVERHLGGPFRLRHHAVQADRVHLLCEADSRPDLASGMQGLLIRVAKALNKLWSHRGRVFADHYDDRILSSPREVHEALRDVFGVGK